MGYLFLILTIITESAAVLLMKWSDGFARKPAAIAAVLCYGMSFVFLTLSLKQLPAGTANAIWAGTSTVLVAVFGVLLFKEHMSAMQWVFLSLIIIGIVGLNLQQGGT